MEVVDFLKIFFGMRIVRRRRRLRPRKTQSVQSKKHFAQYKEQALKLVEERIKHFNTKYGFTYKKISIKNQNTRWGSCSSDGNLNFNYKIVLLPSHLADYIVVHELCHLGEFNHSNKFWDLVAREIPDYMECREELKKTHISIK